MGERVVEAVDLGINVRRLGAIDDLAGREDARRRGSVPARCISDATKISRGLGGRIVDRSSCPARDSPSRTSSAAGTSSSSPCGSVGMGVDQAGDDRLAADVDDLRAGRDRDLAAPADRGDAVAADDDHAVVDDSAVAARHRDDPRAGQRDDPGRLVGGDLHRQRDAGSRRLELRAAVVPAGAAANRRRCRRCRRSARCSSAAARPLSDQWMKSAPSALARVTGSGPPFWSTATSWVPGISGITKAS